MRRYLQRVTLPFFMAVLIIASVMLFYFTQSFHLDNSRLALNKASTHNTGWSVEIDGEITPMEAIPRALTVENGSITLINNLPRLHCDNHALCFRTYSEQIRVCVDDEEIFTYGMNDSVPFGKGFGSVWTLVPLREEMSHKEITIELTALSHEAFKDNYSFFLDNRNTILGTLLAENVLLACNCLLGTAAALMLLISGLLHIRAGLQITRARILLGIFMLFGYIWAFADSGLLQFFLGNKAISHFLVHASLMLMPIPFALYLAELFPRWELDYRRLALFYCAHFLLRLALYILGVIEIGSMVAITHMLIVAGLFYAAILSLSDTKSQINRLTLMGILVFFGFVFLAILFYYLFPHLESGLPFYSLVLSLGLDILMLFFYAALLKGNLRVANLAVQHEHQAYTDSLTQVSNRAAFNGDIICMEPSSHPRLTLFMLDLNNLKQINDTFGHPAGDKLLCTLVRCLQEAFHNCGKIYRYGGDEFIIAIEDTPVAEIKAAQEKLDRLIEEHGRHGGHEISVAIGMATRQNRHHAHLSAQALLQIADKAMYEAKAEQKSLPQDGHMSAEAQLERMDPATGILTFSAFKARVYETLVHKRTSFPCIINFDLNFFDGYNNLFGWDEGNRLLAKMTTLAMNLCGKNGFCAHGYADAFWVFVDEKSLSVITGRIAEETRAFQGELGDCLLFPSFGIYCINERMLPVSDMCSRATSAKKGIKGRLDVLYSVYSAEDHQRRTDNMRLLSFMQKALDSDEFIPHYQPKFSSDGLHLVGAEALARWAFTPGKYESAAEFTALFEKSGLILSLDWYMLEKTCALLRRQLDKGLKCVPVSINFSRMHVYEDDCVQHAMELADKYALPRNLIEIEITETALVQEPRRIPRLIADLRKEGFTVSLDDFGSGLSSLGCLKELDVDVIKLDRSLLVNTEESPRGSSLFEHIVQLCSRLGAHTLAEGVETARQQQLLIQSGCEMVQGNYFSPPLADTAFDALLAAHQD